MTAPRVPPPGLPPGRVVSGGITLRFRASFRAERLQWRAGRPWPGPCGYCGAPIGEERVPFMLWRSGGAAVAICDACAVEAFEVVR